jgi:NAD dependent epimerase/dehydratase family enzyme
MLFGQMGNEAILGSAHVLPAVLERSGFRFQYPALDGALAHELAVTR